MQPDDPYSRVDYRRLIAWPARLEREWPFLAAVLPPEGRVLDLGCGTGEHSRFLASKGFEVTGIDASPAMLAKATEATLPAEPALPGRRHRRRRVAHRRSRSMRRICVGNTLPARRGR